MVVNLVGIDPTRRLELDTRGGDWAEVELRLGALGKRARVSLPPLDGLADALESGGEHTADGPDASVAARRGVLEVELRGRASLRGRFPLDPAWIPLAVARLRAVGLRPIRTRGWRDEDASVTVAELDERDGDVLVHVRAFLDGTWARGHAFTADVLRWVPRSAVVEAGLEAPGLRVVAEDGAVVVAIDDGPTRLEGRIAGAWRMP